MDYVLTLDYDIDPMDPMEGDGQWRLVSFNRNSIHYDKPDKWARVVDAGRVIPANGGLMTKQRVGLFFFLDYYEHGLGAYSIHGGGVQCQWDTSKYGGVLVWEEKPSNMGAKTLADRRKDAEGFLETYNNWMNGQVYGFKIDVADHEEATEDAADDSCWGFYEADYMSMEIAANFKAGDRIMVKGQCKDVFQASKLPAGVEVVDDFEDAVVAG